MGACFVVGSTRIGFSAGTSLRNTAAAVFVVVGVPGVWCAGGAAVWYRRWCLGRPLGGFPTLCKPAPTRPSQNQTLPAPVSPERGRDGP